MTYEAVKTSEKYQLRIAHDEDCESPRNWDNLGTMACWHRRYNLGDKHEFSEPKDLLRSLAEDTLSPKDIIAYVKQGQATNLKLEYDNSTMEWDLKSYSDYFKEWYTEYSAEAPLNMEDGVLSYSILQEMEISDLMTLAEQKNIIMPLFLYDHSIQSISTSTFTGRAQHAEWDSGQVGFVYTSFDAIKENYGDISADTIEKAKALLAAEVETYDLFLRGNCYGYELYEDGAKTDSCWGFVGHFDNVKEDIKGYLPEEAKALADEMSYGVCEYEYAEEMEVEV